MKQKNFKPLLTLVIGIVIGFVINQIKSKDQPYTENQDFSISSYENSKHSISLKETIELRNNFIRRFIKPITALQMNTNVDRGNESYEPTEYLYIELDEMKLYLKFLDYLKSQNPNNKDISGIAINLGAYNLDKESNKGDYKGRLNVFLTPTVKIDNIETPIYLHYKDSKNKYKGSYMPLSDLYNGRKKYSSQLNHNFSNMQEASILNINQTSSQEGDLSLSFNEMGAIPPKPPK